MIEEHNQWSFGCFQLDKDCIVYFSQIVIISACVATSLYNLCNNTNNKDFWIALLSSMTGYILPNPKLR